MTQNYVKNTAWDLRGKKNSYIIFFRFFFLFFLTLKTRENKQLLFLLSVSFPFPFRHSNGALVELQVALEYNGSYLETK